MARNSLQCLSCGEPMPRGLELCLFCNAPLKVDLNVAVDETPQPTVFPPELEVEGPETRPVKPRKVRRTRDPKSKVAAEQTAQKDNSNAVLLASQRRTAVQFSETVILGASRAAVDASSTKAKIVAGIVVLLLLAPLIVSGPVPGDSSALAVTWPMVHSGDEPHNLVLINSVVNDGDLDVANNYANVHSGGVEAGRKFAGWALDHHVVWYMGTRYVHWWQVYETDAKLWQHDADNHPVPTRRANFAKTNVGEHEYSRHSPGMAMLTAPLLVPFRKSAFLEPAALFLMSLATVGGFFAFCSLIGPYISAGIENQRQARSRAVDLMGSDPIKSNIRTSVASQLPFFAVLFGAVAFLGSPLWHYGRTLYPEPLVAALLIGAYAAVLRHQRDLIAGFCLAAAILVEGSCFLIALPLLAEAVWRCDFKRIASLWIPCLLAVTLKLLWNVQMRGGWFRNGELWEWGNPLEGLFGLLLSPHHGILLFAPILVLCLFGLKSWFRDYRRDAVLISSAVAMYVLQMSCSLQWWGGSCYSTRLLIPVLPLMLVPLVQIRHSRWWSSGGWLFGAAVLVILISVEFNAVAAFACEHVHEKHPLELLW